MLKIRNLLYLLLGIAVFGVAFLMSFSGTVATPRVSLEWETASNSESYAPSYDAETGREWAFVYVG